MKCKHCNKEIVLDEEEEWCSDETVRSDVYTSSICDIDSDSYSDGKGLIFQFHQPDLFQEYLKELNEMH